MKRKSICLRMPENLFDAINSESARMMRNELIVNVLTGHFKDRIKPETDEGVQCLSVMEDGNGRQENPSTGNIVEGGLQ